MTPLRRLVAVVKGTPAAVTATWNRLAASSPATLLEPSPAKPPAPIPPGAPVVCGGHRSLTQDGAPRCANCGSLFMPRPAGSPLMFRAHAEICRNCAGYPSIVLERGLAR